jgi:hypothetical protein
MNNFAVRKTVHTLAALVLAILGGTHPGIAQVTATCLAQNGQSVDVPIVVAISSDVARATSYPRPLILVDPDFQHFSQPAKTLILGHECHHVTHSYVNEDEADVYAGRLMYIAGFSADVTVEAAKEVFRFSIATKGHSLPLIRVRSISKGYSDAAREKSEFARSASVYRSSHDPARSAF